MVIENPKKVEGAAMVEELKDDNGVVDRPLTEMTGAEVDEDVSELEVPIGDTPVVGDPVEDESIGPEPAREDNVESAMEDVNVEDVIEA